MVSRRTRRAASRQGKVQAVEASKDEEDNGGAVDANTKQEEKQQEKAKPKTKKTKGKKAAAATRTTRGSSRSTRVSRALSRRKTRSTVKKDTSESENDSDEKGSGGENNTDDESEAEKEQEEPRSSRRKTRSRAKKDTGGSENDSDNKGSGAEKDEKNTDDESGGEKEEEEPSSSRRKTRSRVKKDTAGSENDSDDKGNKAEKGGSSIDDESKAEKDGRGGLLKTDKEQGKPSMKGKTSKRRSKSPLRGKATKSKNKSVSDSDGKAGDVDDNDSEESDETQALKRKIAKQMSKSQSDLKNKASDDSDSGNDAKLLTTRAKKNTIKGKGKSQNGSSEPEDEDSGNGAKSTPKNDQKEDEVDVVSSLLGLQEKAHDDTSKIQIDSVQKDKSTINDGAHKETADGEIQHQKNSVGNDRKLDADSLVKDPKGSPSEHREEKKQNQAKVDKSADSAKLESPLSALAALASTRASGDDGKINNETSQDDIFPTASIAEPSKLNAQASIAESSQTIVRSGERHELSSQRLNQTGEMKGSGDKTETKQAQNEGTNTVEPSADSVDNMQENKVKEIAIPAPKTQDDSTNDSSRSLKKDIDSAEEKTKKETKPHCAPEGRFRTKDNTDVTQIQNEKISKIPESSENKSRGTDTNEESSESSDNENQNSDTNNNMSKSIDSRTQCVDADSKRPEVKDPKKDDTKSTPNADIANDDEIEAKQTEVDDVIETTSKIADLSGIGKSEGDADARKTRAKETQGTQGADIVEVEASCLDDSKIKVPENLGENVLNDREGDVCDDPVGSSQETMTTKATTELEQERKNASQNSFGDGGNSEAGDECNAKEAPTKAPGTEKAQGAEAPKFVAASLPQNQDTDTANAADAFLAPVIHEEGSEIRGEDKSRLPKETAGIVEKSLAHSSEKRNQQEVKTSVCPGFHESKKKDKDGEGSSQAGKEIILNLENAEKGSENVHRSVEESVGSQINTDKSDEKQAKKQHIPESQNSSKETSQLLEKTTVPAKLEKSIFLLSTDDPQAAFPANKTTSEAKAPISNNLPLLEKSCCEDISRGEGIDVSPAGMNEKPSDKDSVSAVHNPDAIKNQDILKQKNQQFPQDSDNVCDIDVKGKALDDCSEALAGTLGKDSDGKVHEENTRHGQRVDSKHLEDKRGEENIVQRDTVMQNLESSAQSGDKSDEKEPIRFPSTAVAAASGPRNPDSQSDVLDHEVNKLPSGANAGRSKIEILAKTPMETPADTVPHAPGRKRPRQAQSQDVQPKEIDLNAMIKRTRRFHNTPSTHKPTVKRRLGLERIKAMLFSMGKLVHRCHGYERIFAEYWEVLTMRLENELSESDCEKYQRVLKLFLKTKKLKKLHNMLIMGLLERCIEPAVPLDEIFNQIPRSWCKRIKLTPSKESMLEDNKHILDTHQELRKVKRQKTESISKESCSDGYGPAFLEPSHDLSGDYGKEVGTNMRIPGALVMDPFVRMLANQSGMKVSENAIWLLVVGMKEFSSTVLKSMISHSKAVEAGQVPSVPPLKSQVLTKTRSSAVADKPLTSQHSSKPNASKCITALDLHSLVTGVSLGGTHSLGGIVSRLAFERSLHASSNSSPASDGHTTEDLRQFITSEIIIQCRKRRRIPVPTTGLTTGQTQIPLQVPTQISSTNQPVTTSKIEPPIDPSLANRSVTTNAESSKPAMPKTNNLAEKVKGPHGGLGRGAKDLAALKARSSFTAKNTSGGDKTKVGEKEGSKNTVVTSGFSGVGSASTPVTAPLTSHSLQEKQGPPSEATHLANIQPSVEQIPKSEEPKSQTAVPVRKGQGKGFGVKNLAAMRARSITSTSPKPEDKAPEKKDGDNTNSAQKDETAESSGVTSKDLAAMKARSITSTSSASEDKAPEKKGDDSTTSVQKGDAAETSGSLSEDLAATRAPSLTSTSSAPENKAPEKKGDDTTSVQRGDAAESSGSLSEDLAATRAPSTTSTSSEPEDKATAKKDGDNTTLAQKDEAAESSGTASTDLAATRVQSVTSTSSTSEDKAPEKKGDDTSSVQKDDAAESPGSPSEDLAATRALSITSTSSEPEDKATEKKDDNNTTLAQKDEAAESSGTASTDLAATREQTATSTSSKSDEKTPEKKSDDTTSAQKDDAAESSGSPSEDLAAARAPSITSTSSQPEDKATEKKDDDNSTLAQKGEAAESSGTASIDLAATRERTVTSTSSKSDENTPEKKGDDTTSVQKDDAVESSGSPSEDLAATRARRTSPKAEDKAPAKEGVDTALAQKDEVAESSGTLSNG